MPLYEYECDACGHRFELIRKFSDPPVTDCTVCSGRVRKLISPPAIQFKGTGWYVTDYARKPSGGQSPDKPAEKPSGESPSAKSAADQSADKSSKSSASNAPPKSGTTATTSNR